MRITITISGPQGSGKTLLHSLLMHQLTANGVNVRPDSDEDVVPLHNASLPQGLRVVLLTGQTPA